MAAAAGNSEGGGPGGRLSRYRRIYFFGDSSERTVFFSDAVFAIAMTLLVLEIQIPEPSELADGERLLDTLAEHWSQFFGYALSFFFIANTWLSHHHVWRLVRRVDPTIQGINLVMLFFVAFTPVPTSIVAEYGPETAVAPVFYALSIAAVGASLLWTFVASHRRGLLDDRVERDMYLMIRRQLMLAPIVFVSSCVIAVLWGPICRGLGAEGAAEQGPLVAMLSWSLLWPAFLVSNRQMRRYLRAQDVREGEVTADSTPAATSASSTG